MLACGNKWHYCLCAPPFSLPDRFGVIAVGAWQVHTPYNPGIGEGVFVRVIYAAAALFNRVGNYAATKYL